MGLPALGGDASGTQQSVTIKGIQGHAVSAASPADQNVLRWNATTGQWEPGTVADATKVPTSTTVNGHALSSNVTVTKTDVGLGSVVNVAQEPALGNPGVNGQVLSSTVAGVRSWVPQTGGGASSVFTDATATNPTFSATPTFSLADVSVKSPVRIEPGALTANVTSVTFTNTTAGAKFSIAWLQDGTGGRTVSYGASASNTCTIDPTPNITTTQLFEVGANGSTVNGVGCITNQAGATFQGTEMAAPGIPAANTGLCWFDSSDHTGFECKANNSANVFGMVKSGADIALGSGTIAANAVSSAKMAAVNTRRTSCIAIGANNASITLADSDLGPQSRQYFINAAATVQEIEVAADAGTPNVIVGRSRAGAIVNLTAAALAAAASGGIACSNTGGTTGIDGTTTCSGTLQNTSLNAGDWITLVSGTAGGTAKEMTVCITSTVN